MVLILDRRKCESVNMQRNKEEWNTWLKSGSPALFCCHVNSHVHTFAYIEAKGKKLIDRPSKIYLSNLLQFTIHIFITIIIVIIVIFQYSDFNLIKSLFFYFYFPSVITNVLAIKFTTLKFFIDLNKCIKWKLKKYFTVINSK